MADLADLDLWLTVASPDLARLTVLAAPGDWLPFAPLLPFGALIGHATDPALIGIAVLLSAEVASSGQADGVESGAILSGLGPGGEDLAVRLAERAREWAGLGRPGAQKLQLTVRPAGDTRPAVPGRLLLRRPSVTIEAGWRG